MTPEQLANIQARADAATEGPWEVDRGVTADCVYNPSGPVTWDDHGGEVFKAADAVFIAHARTDVPALLSLVREQAAQIRRVLELHQSSGGHNPDCHCGVLAGSGANCIECGDVWPCPTIAALTATEGA